MIEVKRGWVKQVNGYEVIRKPVSYHGGAWPRGWPIGIIWHYTAGCGSDLSDVFASRHISAHFSVDRKGQIYQYVSLNRVAWHADRANGLYIGVEHTALPGTCELTTAELAASAALVAGIVEFVERKWGFSIPLRKIDGPDLVPGFHDHRDGDGKLWNLNRHTDHLYQWTWAEYLDEVRAHLTPTYIFEGRRYRRLRKVIDALRERLRRSKPGDVVRIRVKEDDG